MISYQNKISLLLEKAVMLKEMNAIISSKMHILYNSYKKFLYFTLNIYTNLITYCYYNIIHINISKSDETYYIYHQTELLLSSIVITYFGWWKRVFSVSKNIMKNSYSELVGNESVL